MKIDFNNICIIHPKRVDKKKKGKEKQIVFQFNSYKHKLDILRNCKKLKDTNFSVIEDIDKETTGICKEKWKEAIKM